MDNEDRLDRAEQAFEDGEFRAAIIDAKNVLLDDPDNVRGRLLLGRASVEVGDGASAEKEIRRAIQLGTPLEEVADSLARALVVQGKFDALMNEIPIDGLPSKEMEAMVRIAYGDAHMGLQEPESAREMYSAALQLQPDLLNPRLGIVSSFMAENNAVQARAAMDQILDAFPDDPRAWLYSGTLNARIGEYETAEANFGVALDLATSQGDETSTQQALGGLAETLLQQQDVESARAHIEQLSASAPQSLQTKLLMARIAYNDQDWAAAQQNLQQVLQVAPNYRPAQVLLGTVHLRSGNLAQAENYLTVAVASMPNDVRARQLLAETHLQLRHAEEAQAALAPILSSPDADLMSLQMAARASLGREDIDEALEYLRRGVQQNPDNADLRFQLAVSLMLIGRNDEAQEVLDSIDVSGSRDNAYRRDSLGVLTSIKEGKTVAALEAAQKLAETYNDRFGAHNLLGAVQAAGGDMENATTSFEKSLTLSPKDIVARRYLAAIDESGGDWESAASRYEGILEDNPNAAWAMFALGRITVQDEDFEGAAGHFRHALEASPDNADYRLSLARVERQLGNRNRAIALLEEDKEATFGHFQSALMLGALKVESDNIDAALDIASELQGRYPENPASYAFEGEIRVFGGDFTLADSEYDKACALGPLKSHALRSYAIKRRLGSEGAERPLVEFLETRPLDTEVRILLAEAYMQAENLGKAIAAYERVVSEDPTNAVALNNLAWNYYLVDDRRAIDTAKKALDAMPNNGAIVDTLGWIMVQRGRLEEGEKILRQAVEMDKGRAEIRFHHAVALAKLGETDKARVALQEILKRDEEFASRSEAEKLLAEL